MGPESLSEWEKQRDSSVQALSYAPASHDLAARMLEALNQWEAGAADLSPIERQWRIAEALHLLTWLRPQSHSPLCVLFDDERHKASAASLRAP